MGLTVKTGPSSLAGMGVPVRRAERSPAKRRQILEGARLAFGELGYERSSVDLVAARAGVAKATVYSHFDDKKALFVACFSQEADALREELRQSLTEPGGDLRISLRRVGEKLVRILVSPAFVSLYRQTAAEAARFPEVGETLFARGPAVVYQALADWLRRWEALGALRLDDARSAAVQFVMLCQGDLVVRSQLGILPRASDTEVRDTVRRAVRTFLLAYAP
jgi:TetR/AcrR family transcriptional regulator, mexJK operon transcriptional repressor